MSNHEPKRVELAQPLSKRQWEVVQGLANGLTSPQIAKQLGISVAVVRFHIRSAGNKIPGDLPLTQRIIHWFHGGETIRLRRAPT